jgi:Na+-driven multidrug efflux pump
MLAFQTAMGLIMTVVFVGAAERIRAASLSYVPLSAPVALSSAIQVAVASSTRALDQPDVPLIISSVGFTLNIVLDLLVISKFHVGSYTPAVLTQAGIKLACDMISAIAGVLYFVYLTKKLKRGLRLEGVVEDIAPQMKA